MRILFIGAGNVATILGKKCLEAGHEIVGIVSRTKESAAELADKLNCGFAAELQANMELPKADVYLFAVPDNALYDMQPVLINGGVVAHTAGSVSAKLLEKFSNNYGVFYPLQSIREEANEHVEVPILIEGSNAHTENALVKLAESISDKVEVCGYEKRREVHVAAVFINNFTNHLYALAYNYCQEHQLDFNILLPLLKETANRQAGQNPAIFQTGPAKRKDSKTIEAHKTMLAYDDHLLHIYDLLTASIMALKT